MHEKLIQDITKYLVKDLIPEITVSKPVPNNLQRLLALQKEIKTTKDKKRLSALTTKDKKRLSALAILCAELVLPIWDYYYPNDGRVKQTIDAAKQGRYAAADADAAAVDAAAADNAAAAYAADAAAAAAANCAAAATAAANCAAAAERQWQVECLINMLK